MAKKNPLTRTKYRRPRLATMSTIPAVYALQESVERMRKQLAYLPERAERGRALFLLDMAGVLRAAVQRRAPEVVVAGQPTPYARDLRIAVLSGVERDEDAVALYFEHEEAALAEDAQGRTALFYKGKSGSPGWVNVLSQWGPWPAALVPVKVEPHHARVIARRVRPDEIQALTARLMARRKDIEEALEEEGAKGARLRTEGPGMAGGTVVHEDVGWNVLRAEFGWDGTPARAHWRPALRETLDAVPAVLGRFQRYLETGNEGAFELPSGVDQDTVRLLADSRFVKELAPFVE